MSNFIRPFLCAFFAVMPGTVIAQGQETATGSRLLPSEAPITKMVEKSIPSLENDKLVAKFTDCLIKQRGLREQAVIFVRLEPGSEESISAGKKVTRPNCLPGLVGQNRVSQMSFSSFGFRLSLMESLYRYYFPEAPVGDLSALPRLNHASEFKAGFVPDDLAGLRPLGDCIVRGDSISSHAFVTAKIHSLEEKIPLAGILKQLEMCTPPGLTLGFEPAVLRGTIAEALFRLRQTAKGRKN